MAVTWDILVCSIPHRDALLRRLLGVLDPQMLPGVRVLVMRDNLESTYGEKCQALLEASDADYVSFIDDDDSVCPWFVQAVMMALADRPDYVGFQVLYTVDGEVQVPVEHSLRHGRWNQLGEGGILVRDIVHFNPIRRELALLGRWEGGWQADYRWASQVRASGRVRHEIFYDVQMYLKQDTTGHGFGSYQPVPDAEYHALAPPPAYPWLEVL